MAKVRYYYVTVGYADFDWRPNDGKPMEMIDVVKLLCDIARDTDVRSFRVAWAEDTGKG